MCVVTEPEAEPVNLSGREVDKVCEISGMSEVCASLETLSKVRHSKTIFFASFICTFSSVSLSLPDGIVQVVSNLPANLYKIQGK